MGELEEGTEGNLWLECNVCDNNNHRKTDKLYKMFSAALFWFSFIWELMLVLLNGSSVWYSLSISSCWYP